MLNKEQVIDFIKKNFDQLNSDHCIVKIGLIGSFARDEQTDESDIDLLIEFRPGTKDLLNRKSEIKRFFKTHLNRDVDVCREKYLKPYVKDHILNEVIYA